MRYIKIALLALSAVLAVAVAQDQGPRWVNVRVSWEEGSPRDFEPCEGPKCVGFTFDANRPEQLYQLLREVGWVIDADAHPAVSD